MSHNTFSYPQEPFRVYRDDRAGLTPHERERLLIEALMLGLGAVSRHELASILMKSGFRRVADIVSSFQERKY